MRMNGGIIGKLNKPSNYSANGVWKWSERYANILDYRFPTYYPGFDLSNIISKQTQYTNKSFLVGLQEGNPSALFFKPDGTKLYVTGTSSDNVHQYSLSTAWDISTASYDNIKIAIAAQETSSTGLFFKSDGTKMYIFGSSSDNVHQYSLSTAWNVATVTYDSVNFSVNAQDGVPEDVFFKSDGTKMYILGGTNDRVFQYSLSSAWVVSSASYDNISYSVAAQDTGPSGLYFKDDGTKMYILGNATETIYQYSLATAWNVATASVDSNPLSIADYDTVGSGLFFKPDGSKLYFTGDLNNRIYEFDVGDPWNIRIYPGYNGVSFSVATQETTPNGISFKSDGTKMYIVGINSDRVQQYALSTPWNLTTASYEANVSIVGQTTTSQAIHFKSDGTKMYVTDGGMVTYQYTLATPWSVTSATYDSVSYDFGSGGIPSIVFKSDGTKIYAGGDTITQYTASSAWSIASPVSDSKSYSIISNTGLYSESTIQDFFISPDGSKLWALGSTNGRIYQYTFGTSWDISTLSYSKSYYIGDLDNTITGIHFKPNGEKLFLVGSSNDTVYELNMTA